MKPLLLLPLLATLMGLGGCATTEALQPFENDAASRLYEMRDGYPVALHAAPEVEPKIVQRTSPVLPPSVEFGGIHTEVKVSYIITAEGYTSSVRVIEATSPEAGQAVVNAVRSWVFTPALNNGEPVPVVQMLRYSFGVRYYQ